jgi:carboxypeptidase family protein/TonB-dependent receptor-like protein
MRALGRTTLLASLAFTAWVPAGAQTATGSIRGYVRNPSGAPIGDVQVVARDSAMGTTRGAVSSATGFYAIPGLRPGLYQLTARRIGLAPQTRNVQVLIGQTQVVEFTVAEAAVQLQAVVSTASAARVVETRTPEVGMNVTREQIDNLPQQDRNFLNFAGLAPGITVSRTEDNKQIKAGGLNASKINVFIDGTSFKNDILEGGVHGQDASRGNPFPQLAIQEFRVITQNFKAEYQRAASAVVTATTKSGTNELEIDAFFLGQNKDLVGVDPGTTLRCRQDNVANCSTAFPKPTYERYQFGMSAGGPIVRDRLHYFVGYEGNIQNRDAQVTVGQAQYRTRFAQYEGIFQQPFRSHLPFGKLSWQSTPNQTVDVSYAGRIESDKRNYGGTTSFESAENVKIGYHVLTLQHGWSRGNNWFNQAHVSAQRSTWNPTVVNQNQEIGQLYENVIRIGARSSEQKFVQDRLELRNDVTYTGFRWLGNHVFKGGGNLDLLKYDVEKRFNAFPEFVYNPTESMDVPIRAVYGLGDPGMNERNVQFGLFAQDDWDVTDRLQLNVGVRWDAETNVINNNWVTPDSIRTQFGNGITARPNQRFTAFNPSDYFTSGRSDRPLFLGAFQPRIGFSLDVSGTGATVVHGGVGVYYDREIWNRLIDERFRLQWRVLTFPFTTTGEPNEIPWQPSYLSRQGLESILNQANPPGLAEIFLLRNDTKPTYTHQWNVGLRQSVLGSVVGAAYRGVRGYNILSWYCATPHSVHGFCEGLLEQSVPNFKGLLLATDEGRSWYDALDLTFERPMAGRSRWGATLAYTYAEGKRKGNDFFTLDYPGVEPKDWPREPANVEKHRINASAIVALPLDFQVSTLAQWGSGVPFNLIDERLGWGPARKKVFWAIEDPPDFRQVDVRLQKNFRLPTVEKVGLIFEVINVFNYANFREADDFYRNDAGVINQNFGRPRWWTGDTGRRLQLGLTVGH